MELLKAWRYVSLALGLVLLAHFTLDDPQRLQAHQTVLCIGQYEHDGLALRYAMEHIRENGHVTFDMRKARCKIHEGMGGPRGVTFGALGSGGVTVIDQTRGAHWPNWTEVR